MAGTINPSGLTITRDGNLKFAISWKVADKDYKEGQKLRWRVWLSENGNQTAWTTLDINVSLTSHTVTIPVANYYPTTKKKIYYFEVEVCGKRQQTTEKVDNVDVTTVYDWSAWTNAKRLLRVPNAPVVTAELDSQIQNRTTFTWEVETDAKDNRPFRNVEWQSMIVANCKETNGAKLKWKSSASGWTTGTGSASGEWAKTDDFTVTSRTRWFRVRARGAGGKGDTPGCSAWKYRKHVYATPYAASINTAKVTEKNNVSTILVNWTAASDAAHPIDQTIVQYVITTPAAGLTCPAGANWTNAATFADTTGKDSAQFTVSDAVGLDECLFVRIATVHDSRTAYSAPKLVKKGALKNPSGLSVTPNQQTYRAVVNATNNSTVPDSQLAVIYRSGKTSIVVGIIPHGGTSVTVQCPVWSATKAKAFGVYAFQGTATPKTRADGVTVYAITRNLKSSTVWDGGAVPVAPEGFTAVMSDDAAGEAILSWNWSWEEANLAEISWSTNQNAWESTDEPNTYTLDNLHAASWRVSGLDTGMRWYFRVRLIQQGDDEGMTYGPYSETVYVDLSSAPAKPVLSLSNAVITQDGTVTASWAYVTTDGTNQAFAEICEYDEENDTYGTPIAHTQTAQHVSLSAGNWVTGETYNICVRVTSASGFVSEWSDPVPVIVAEPAVCAISASGLVEETITDGSETRQTLSLKTMPLSVTVTGAGEGGTTTVIVERAQDYHMIRPDDTETDGYEGETIVLFRQTGEDPISIGTDILLGRLDDGAPYRMIAVVEDGLGQSDSQEIGFEVHWTHQAGEPSATVVMENNAAVITPSAPESYAQGDTCDIYRLSVDSPQLIVKGGTYGEAYVDPYPTIGEHGGYRVVCLTSNQDYITEEEQPAWIDIRGDLLSQRSGIISFNGEDITLPYNLKLTSSWKKDFKETKYLGGTIKGDWNPGVSRSGSLSTVVLTEDTELIEALRRLAGYSGICHVRTPDGSSFAADVQVSNNAGYTVAGRLEEFTLSITRVEPDALDGIPYSDWMVSA